jgi:6-phosphogluconolactonase (cycloisomerase 2 family)
MFTRFSLKNNTLRLLLAVLFALPLLAGTVGSAAASGGTGFVYTETNAAAGNAIQVYTRGANGGLTAAASFPTGGLGTGASLGSQSAVDLSAAGHWLFAVNAGSNDISVFSIMGGTLHLTDRTSARGTDPISLTVSRSLLYVLNAGNGGNIAGFRIKDNGALTFISGSLRKLSNNGVGAAPSPEQIGFTPDGEHLVVSEKGSNEIDTYTVDNGVAYGPIVNTSFGPTPYGFGFSNDNHLVISEAAISSASSYKVTGKGLTAISGSVADTQAAACWLVVNGNGTFAYAANAGSGNISAYQVTSSGKLTLLTPGGINGVTGTGSHPVDMAFGSNSQFLYVLASGNTTINAFRIHADGTLTFLASYSSPAAATGLAAR